MGSIDVCNHRKELLSPMHSETQESSRIQALLASIANLQRENRRLRKLLEDNGIVAPESSADDVEELDQGSRILPYAIDKTKVNQFFARFWGRMDVYSQRIVSKSGTVGYYPQCRNFWKDGCFRKQRPGEKGKRRTCKECPLRSWRPVELTTILRHLRGEIIVGIYPLFADDTCRFLVFDFDNHDADASQQDFANNDSSWKREVEALRDICKENGLHPLVERSRSGKGAHLWLFFSIPISAGKARAFGEALLAKGAETINLTSFQFYDRMLPAQDHLPDGGLGNLIALPLQPEALRQGNSAFVDEHWNAYPDQWAALLETPKLQPTDVEQCIQKWQRQNPFAAPASESEQGTQMREKPWERAMRFHASDVRGCMSITESNLIYIDALNIAPRLQNQLRRLAAFHNPVFYKNQAMHLSNFAHTRFVYLGEDVDGYIALPRGLHETLRDHLERADIPSHVDDERQPGRSIRVTFQGQLQEIQKHAMKNMLRYDNGILSAATAFGKTVVCCAMIAERKTSTLILLQSSALIDQWKAALKRFLSIDEDAPTYKTKSGRTRKRKELIGILQGAKDTTTGIIDIAMVGSVYGKHDFAERMQSYGMVLVDECHHAASETMQRVLRDIRAKYVYGVTATPIREDGLEKINYMLLGPIRFRYTSKERAIAQGIAHLVIPRFTRCVSPRGKQLTINEAYELVRDSETRNEQILADAKTCIDAGRCPVLLTRYKEHARMLFEKLDGYADHTFLLLGESSAKDKRDMFVAMQAVPPDESVLLVATGKLIGEGFDYPRLDTLLMATPVAGRSVVEQYAGRLNRDYDGKTEVIIYDYIDAHIPVFDRMYGKRLRAYRQIGYVLRPSIQQEPGQKEQGFIFDIDSYKTPFFEDLAHAEKEIVICSPSLRRTKVEEFLQQVRPVQECGVKIVVLTWQMDADKYGSSDARAALLERMRKAGIELCPMGSLSEHFAIIDHRIVWYGSMNFLGKEDVEDNLMRIENPDAAEELLEHSAHPNENA